MPRLSYHNEEDIVEYVVDRILSDYILHGMIVKEMHYLRGKGYTLTGRPSLKDRMNPVIRRIVVYLEQTGDIPAGTRSDRKRMTRITAGILQRI